MGGGGEGQDYVCSVTKFDRKNYLDLKDVKKKINNLSLQFSVRNFGTIWRKIMIFHVKNIIWLEKRMFFASEEKKYSTPPLKVI